MFSQTWPQSKSWSSMTARLMAVWRRIERLGRPNLKIVSQENRGQTDALNTCLAHATGEYIQFLDADDLIAPDKIALQMERLARHSNCVASAEWGRFRTDPAETVFAAEPVWRDLDPLDWLALSRAQGLGMMYPALWLVPRSLVDEVGPWCSELTLNNDAEYFTRILLKADRVLFCGGARTYYRSGIQGSLSGAKSPARGSRKSRYWNCARTGCWRGRTASACGGASRFLAAYCSRQLSIRPRHCGASPRAGAFASSRPDSPRWRPGIQGRIPTGRLAAGAADAGSVRSAVISWSSSSFNAWPRVGLTAARAMPSGSIQQDDQHPRPL